LALPETMEQLATLGYDLVASTPNNSPLKVRDRIMKVICAANIRL
jgi:hypothetical protein